MSDTSDLFKEFEGIEDSSWLEKVEADLKGKNIEDLIWEDESGIEHKPYYRKSDLPEKSILEEISNSQKKNSDWKSLQCFSSKEENLKKKISNALNNGVDQVILTDLSSYQDLVDSLGGKYKGKDIVKAYLDYIPKRDLLDHFYLDPISSCINKNLDIKSVDEELIKLFQERLNQLEPDRFLLVDSSTYKMRGATIVEEMALSLQHAVEYFDKLTEAGFTPDAIARSLEFKMSFGTSFFPEVAKGRAMRYLIQKLYQSYKANAEVSLWGEGSLYYLSNQDVYTNLLRSSSMTMAAVLGNCDKISTPAFDQLGFPSKLGIRMAKNIQLILKNEAYFGQVKDMVGGSYYLENLTATLADRAWKKFLSFESKGGLLKLVNSGELEELLASSHQSRVNLFNKGKVFLGVNKYPNPQGDEIKSDDIRIKDGLKAKLLALEIERV